MSDNIIDFYRQANDAKTEELHTPVNEELAIDQPQEMEAIADEVPNDPFARFLVTLNKNLKNKKQINVEVPIVKEEEEVNHIRKEIVVESEERQVHEEINDGEDPFMGFIDKLQSTVRNKKQQDIKNAAIGFINELKEKPEDTEEDYIEEVIPDIKPVYVEPKVEIVSKKPEAVKPIGDIKVPVVEVKQKESPYVEELKIIGQSKKTPKASVKQNDIKTLISQQVEAQSSKMLEDVKAYAKRILDLGGGGGSVAQQFANGGTMNGNLNVTGKYLSAGVELSSIFSGGGGGGSSDRLVSGSASLILNADGTLQFPNNTIRSSDDTEIVLESENVSLSAYTQVALTPHGFIAYDNGGDSISFDSVSNTIVFKTVDNYTWTLDSQGNIIGPDDILSVLGSLNTSGNILSGGRNLDQIFLTTETDSQTLTYTPSSYNLSISNGNTVSLASLSSTPPDLSLLSTTSGDWNEAYNISTVYANNSASYATLNYVDSNFLNLTGGIITGETHFNGNVTVFGNLTATGTTTFANTIFTTTSALSVVHFGGSGPAIYVGNDGAGDIASFYDIDANLEILHVGGNNGSFPNVGVKTSTPNKTLTVSGEISATSDITTSGKFYIEGDGNSDQWNSAYNTTTAYQNTSATFLTIASAESTYAKLSSNAYTFDPSVSSIDTVNGSNIASGIFSGVLGGNCNTAPGNYSTITGGFSSCATGYATFVGAGSGNSATGDYAVAVGGIRNTASGPYSTIGGGSANRASGSRSVVVGGSNHIASGLAAVVLGGGNTNTASGNYSIILGGYGNNNASGGGSAVLGGQGNTSSGNNSVVLNGVSNVSSGNTSTVSGYGNTAAGSRSAVIGGRCNNVTSSGIYSNINGGLGNFNPLRDSIIGGGVANHTGGFAPFNITAAASISGNGSQTRFTGTGIQSLFSFPFASNNVSLYYATPSVPLSAGVFVTATIAATGTNFVVVNGDYSTCTPTGLSATSVFVYDRAINNVGHNNVIGGGKLNTASANYGVVGGGFCNRVQNGSFGFVGGGRNNNNCNVGFGVIAGGENNTITNFSNYGSIAGGRANTVSNWYSSIGGGSFNFIGGQNSAIAGGSSNSACNNGVAIAGGCSNTASGFISNIGGGLCNTIIGSGLYSTIGGGRFNHNPLFNSNIQGGSFNHTGGFTPVNITSSASISGNGTNTVLIATGIGSCFSASNTTGAVGIVFTTQATGPSLSAACFGLANVVTNPGGNCITINGNYSTCTANSVSATSIYVYDRCVNIGRCNNFIGGGILNTASGNYSVLGGGRCNTASGTYSFVGSGTENIANANYSFIAGGQCNSANEFTNAFILGTGLSASAANFTYVNNLSSQGVVVANPLRVGNSQSATGPVGSITGKVEIFNATGASLGFIPVYDTIT